MSDPSGSEDTLAQPGLPVAPALPKKPVGAGFVLKPWHSLIAGALYGLLMRLLLAIPIFSGGNGAGGAMLVSFLFAVPLLIGALTVFLTPRDRRRFSASLWQPLLPMALFLVGSAVLLLEGSICIVLAAPIFLLMSSIGGALTYVVLNAVEPSRSTMGSLLLLPLLGGAMEAGRPLPDHRGMAETSIHVNAPAATIWRLINDAREIRNEEMASGLAYHIGVPYPRQALTMADGRNGGWVRKLSWDRGVHFDEPILDWDENRYIRWSYHFAADSIPAGALDEHVAIGGRYFELVDTSYRLEPDGQGTRLTILVNYRISTPFNFYAARVGDVLVGDAARTILQFYKKRSERAAAG